MTTIQTVIISIENSSRRPIIGKYLQEQGINFEFLNAVNKNNVIRDDYMFKFENYKIGVNSDNHFPDSFRGRKWANVGEIGVLLSHFIAWKKLLNSEYEYFLILEDDALPLFTGNELLNFVERLDLSNLDLISCQCIKPSYEQKESFKGLSDALKVPCNDLEFDELVEGAAGYIVTRSGAKKLSYAIEQNGMVFPADNHIWRCAKHSGNMGNIKFHEEKFNWRVTTKNIQVSLYKQLSDSTQIHNTDAKHLHEIPETHKTQILVEQMSNGISYISNNIPLDNI